MRRDLRSDFFYFLVVIQLANTWFKKKNLLQAISAIMAKVRISSDVIKPFSGEGDVVAWLKKVRLVARLQNMDDVASLLPLYLEGDALALYMEMEETSQRDIEQTESQLKETFTDNAFAAYRILTMVRWMYSQTRSDN